MTPNHPREHNRPKQGAIRRIVGDQRGRIGSKGPKTETLLLLKKNDMVETKQCPKCGETKGRDGFYKRNMAKDGLTARCKTCSKAVDRAIRSVPNYYNLKYAKAKEKDPQLSRKRGLKGKYGITLEQYDEMYGQQKGVCAICGLPEITKDVHGNVRNLSVDHDHKTGKVRNLLCCKCNTGIGVFNDDPKILVEAMKYLLCHG